MRNSHGSHIRQTLVEEDRKDLLKPGECRYEGRRPVQVARIHIFSLLECVKDGAY